MKIRNMGILIGFLLLFLWAATADAKWWIFGTSEDEVTIGYLFLNKTSFDEAGAKVTLYREMLPDGRIIITGKATVKKGTIGNVRVSTDDKQTWKDATLSESGAFEFSFKPDIGKTYAILIEVSDTTGKTNDVAATRREVTVAERNIMGVIKDAMDKLIDAYKREDPAAFMALVSSDFVGDVANLDRAIRKDFSSFDNIDLRYTLNNVTSNQKGISVSINFNRLLVSTKSGKTLSDKGMTEFVFKLGDAGPRVFSMKNPLIFGLTDSSNVATGTVTPVIPDPIILVDTSGNVAKVPSQVFTQAVTDDTLRIVNNTDGTSTVTTSSGAVTVNPAGTSASKKASESVDSGGRTVVTSGHPPGGFTFVDGQVVAGGGDFMITGHCPGPPSAYGGQNAGVTIIDLGVQSLSAITEAPASGYSSPAFVCFTEGHSFAFKLANGKYGLIEVRSVTTILPTITMRFDYKYQTNGTRQFLP
jgi:hypothetical protein